MFHLLCHTSKHLRRESSDILNNMEDVLCCSQVANSAATKGERFSIGLSLTMGWGGGNSKGKSSGRAGPYVPNGKGSWYNNGNNQIVTRMPTPFQGLSSSMHSFMGEMGALSDMIRMATAIGAVDQTPSNRQPILQRLDPAPATALASSLSLVS